MASDFPVCYQSESRELSIWFPQLKSQVPHILGDQEISELLSYHSKFSSLTSCM